MWDTVLGFILDIAKDMIGGFNKSCEIKLAPEFCPSIPYPMNGGHMQEYANFQIRFGSETSLELIDAILVSGDKVIRCEQRDSKLNGGRDWNSFNFIASKLTYVHNHTFVIKIRVSDHERNCCELLSDLQMQQFPPSDDVKSGRWEIQPKGIFKIKRSRKKKF